MVKDTEKNAPGLFGKMGTLAKKWFSGNVEKVDDLGKDDPYAFDFTTASQSLLGTGRRAARMRAQIYQKWSFMEGDPIVSGALSLIVTSALGGHETTGNTVFIEKKAETIKNIKLAKMVDEIDAALTPKLNQMAHCMAYNGATFGDSYARPYVDSSGIRELYFGEIVRPPMVQAYEKGNRTVGYMVYSGAKAIERLDTTQLLRLKMPRQIWVPQFAVQDKVIKMALSEDDLDELPILPSMVGVADGVRKEMQDSKIAMANGPHSWRGDYFVIMKTRVYATGRRHPWSSWRMHIIDLRSLDSCNKALDLFNISTIIEI